MRLLMNTSRSSIKNEHGVCKSEALRKTQLKLRLKVMQGNFRRGPRLSERINRQQLRRRCNSSARSIIPARRQLFLFKTQNHLLVMSGTPGRTRCDRNRRLFENMTGVGRLEFVHLSLDGNNWMRGICVPRRITCSFIVDLLAVVCFPGR